MSQAPRYEYAIIQTNPDGEILERPVSNCGEGYAMLPRLRTAGSSTGRKFKLVRRLIDEWETVVDNDEPF